MENDQTEKHKTTSSTSKVSPEYLEVLLKEKDQLENIPATFENLSKLLDMEIARVRRRLDNPEQSIKQEANDPEDEPAGSIVTLQEKVFVPVDENPNYNFVGRLLGPRGLTAKQLESDLDCKIMVRGRGSLRDKRREEMNRGKPNWEHLEEDLHVLVSVEDFESKVKSKLERATKAIRTFLEQGVRTPENEDRLKQLQLMELAVLNDKERQHQQHQQQLLIRQHQHRQQHHQQQQLASLLAANQNAAAAVAQMLAGGPHQQIGLPAGNGLVVTASQQPGPYLGNGSALLAGAAAALPPNATGQSAGMFLNPLAMQLSSTDQIAAASLLSNNNVVANQFAAAKLAAAAAAAGASSNAPPTSSPSSGLVNPLLLPTALGSGGGSSSNGPNPQLMVDQTVAAANQLAAQLGSSTSQSSSGESLKMRVQNSQSGQYRVHPYMRS